MMSLCGKCSSLGVITVIVSFNQETVLDFTSYIIS